MDAARGILNGAQAKEKTRLDRIRRALDPNRSPTVEIPSGAPATMRQLADKARTNYLPLILNIMAQSMIVEGYRPGNTLDNARPWQSWQRNKLDARQSGVHRNALRDGFSYTVVTPGELAGQPSAAIRGVSARKLTAVYADPGEDDWPLLALRHDADLLKLYDEEQVYYLGRPGNRVPGSSPSVGPVEFIESHGHGLGVCPVVRFRNVMLLDEEDQIGIIEPLISIQQRVDETVFGLLVAQFYTAFRQRAIIGWVPGSEEEQLRASASHLWTFDDPDVKLADFSESDLTRYLESKDSGVGDMATISQVPKQNLGVGAVSNMSAEALAAMEASKDRQVTEFETSLGESWEQTLRLSALADGDGEAAEDESARVRWKDATARSFAQMVDGLGKMVQMLGVPAEMAWERIPDWTDQDTERARALRAEGDALGGLAALLDQQAAPLEQPPVFDQQPA